MLNLAMPKVVVAAAALTMLAACGTQMGDRLASGAAIGAGAGAIAGPVGAGAGALIGAGTAAVTEPDDVNLGKPVWNR